MQTAVIADQNDGKKRGKDKLWKRRACFSCKCFQGGRTRRLQMQLELIKQPKTMFEFDLPLLSLIPKGTPQFLVQFVPVVDFFTIRHLFVVFKMTRSTPPICLLSNPLHSHRFQIPNTAYSTGLYTSSKYISCSRSKRNTYVPAILFQKIKTSCLRMTKLGNVQNSE